MQWQSTQDKGKNQESHFNTNLYIFAAKGFHLNLKGSNQSSTLQNYTSKIKGNIINKWQQHEDLSSNNPVLGQCVLSNYTHNLEEVKNLAISCAFWWMDTLICKALHI